MTTKTPLPEVFTSPSQAEEVLIVDEREAMRPSELVERKLVAMLQTESLPVSQLQQTRSVRR